MKKLILSVLLTICFLAMGGFTLFAKAPPQDMKWVATWEAPEQMPYHSGISHKGFQNQTVRMIIHPQASGTKVRIRLSNLYGARSVTFDHVVIAKAWDRSNTKLDANHDITFGKSHSVTIYPGADVLSDPVTMNVDNGKDLAISLYVSAPTGPATWHAASMQFSYLATGDRTRDRNHFIQKSTGWFFLENVEVLTKDSKPRVIVALGDSITDGSGSTVNVNHRWPNFLEERLKAKYSNHTISVINAGISGNKILRNSRYSGASALSRLNRDVLSQTGITDVILLEGINDIGHKLLTLDSNKIIAGMKQIASQVHARGLNIYGGTLTPFRGAASGYFTEDGEEMREAVNQWIRTSGAFDGVIDFDKSLRDPKHPQRLLPVYDSGDHLHPNDGGYKAMANAIDLSLFAP